MNEFSTTVRKSEGDVFNSKSGKREIDKESAKPPPYILMASS